MSRKKCEAVGLEGDELNLACREEWVSSSGPRREGEKEGSEHFVLASRRTSGTPSYQLKASVLAQINVHPLSCKHSPTRTWTWRQVETDPACFFFLLRSRKQVNPLCASSTTPPHHHIPKKPDDDRLWESITCVRFHPYYTLGFHHSNRLQFIVDAVNG